MALPLKTIVVEVVLAVFRELLILASRKLVTTEEKERTELRRSVNATPRIIINDLHDLSILFARREISI